MYNGFAVLRAYPEASMAVDTKESTYETLASAKGSFQENAVRVGPTTHSDVLTPSSDDITSHCDLGSWMPTRLEIIERYEGHGSIAYGADWFQGPNGHHIQQLVATCSFYDGLLHLWSPSSC